MNQKVKVGIIGFGRMGGFYLEEMRKINGRYFTSAIRTQRHEIWQGESRRHPES